MIAPRSLIWSHHHKLGGGLVLTLMASLLVVPALAASLTVAPAALAVEPPQGGLVDSVEGFGRTLGEFSVSGDGAALYSLPLWTPEGRGEGVALGLSYHSNGGNGLVGVGWSVAGLSSITWCSRTFAQDGHTDGGHTDGTDALCLDGNRLMPTTGAGLPQRAYRTEEESFARITAFGAEDNVPNYFRVESKDGLINTYGQTNDSRLTGFTVPRDGSPQASVAWALNKIEDRNGNATTIDYYQEHGSEADNWFVDMRPRRVTYPPNRRIEFVYQNEVRPDVLDGFQRGVHTRTTRLLDRVEMFGGPQGGAEEKLREYRLRYANYSITGRSLLRQVVDCDGRGVCMRPLDLQWSAGGYEVEEIDTTIDGFSGVGALDQLMAGDIDGDGRDDIVYRHKQLGWLIRHSTGGGFGLPVTAGIPALEFTGQQMRPIDFDRDGRLDMMAEVPDDSIGGTGWKLFRSNGLCFEPYSDNIGYFGPDDRQLDPIYFADLNGDGLPDFLTAKWDFEPPQGDPDIDGPWRYRLNRGTEVGGRFAPEVNTQSLLPARPDENRVLDSDGDGRSELVGEDNQRYPDKRWIALGLNAAGGVETPAANLHLLTGSASYRQHFGDMNGDGLADQFLTYGAYRADEDTVINGSLYASLGSGLGVGQSSPGAGNFDTQPEENASIIADFNNDGNDDLLSLRSHPFGDAAQQGAQLFAWRNGSLARAEMPHPLLVGSHNVWDDGDGRESDYSNYKWRYARTLDIDGNGVLDIVHIKLDKLHLKKRKDPMPDRLVGIGTYGLGPRIEVDYTNLADTAVHTKATCTYPLVCLNTGGTVVKEHRFATYQPVPQDWDRYRHTYEHARADMRGRGWLGFAKHTATRTLDGTTKTTEFDNTATDGGTGGVPLAYPYAHLPKKVTTLVTGLPPGSGYSGTRERRHTVTTSNVIRRLGLRYTVEPQIVVDAEEERLTSAGSWQTLRGIVTTTTFDAFGNPDLKVTATVGGRTLTEDPTFRNDEAAWLIGLPTRISTRSCTAGSRCATRVTTQDYYPNGNLKETVTEPQDPALKLTATMVYGTFGTVTSVTEKDNAGTTRVTSFEYDADNMYPTVTVNPAGHRSLLTTHSGLSVPIAATGPNGAGVEKITMRYDRFGRPRELHRGDGASEIITHATFLGAQVVTTRLSGGGRSAVLTDWFDREYEREVLAFDGRTATTYTGYDAFGRATTVSRPTLGGTRYNTITAYDRLDRPTQVTAPDGATVRHEYLGRETHTYDAKGVHSYTAASPDGDVVSSFEDDPASAAWLHTRFEYGAFGLPSKITAPDNTVQSMTYDTLGNRTALVDPVGSTTTTYTAFGEVRTETDGTGSTATYTHDALSRVIQVMAQEGRTTSTWDTAEHGIGRLASSDSPDNILTRYQYNELSQHTSTSWKIGAETFQLIAEYDQFGRQAATTYPHVFTPGGYERLKVRYGYNANGYLGDIRDAAAPAGTPPIWTAEARDAAGQLERERLGNGALTTNEYTPIFLLSHTVTDGPGTVGRLADISYARDANRNVTGRQDAVDNRAETYGYDTLNRLASWRLRHGTTDTTTAYTYDKAGNLKTETAPGVSRIYHYGENGAPPHVLTGMGDDHQRFTYDGAGRQLTAPRRTVTYNRAGLPKTLTYGQQQHVREFAYDAAGERVRRTDAAQGITQITIGGVYERRIPPADDLPAPVGVEHVHNISVEGRIVAQVTKRQDSLGGPITAVGVQYLHSDAQGSIVRVSTRTGSPRTEFFYDPWGQRITGDGQPTSRNEGAPRQGYTGHEHDDNYGLINMRGRMYDPETRRFLTSDPVITDPVHSQSLNRYTYVRNNPATLTDPTGLDPSEGSSICTLECPGMGPWKELNPMTLVIDPDTHPQDAGDQGQTKSDGDTATDKGKADPAAPNTPTCEDCAGSGEAVQIGDPAIADYYEKVAYSGVVDRDAAANLIEMAIGIRDGSVEAPSETIMVVGADRTVLEKRESLGRSMAALEMVMGFVVEQACGWVGPCDLIMTVMDIAENGFDPLGHTISLLPFVPGGKLKPKGVNKTSRGFKRTNAKDWRKLRDSWDEAGFGDALSEANRKNIKKGKTPVVDDAWIEYFPGDAALKGELIPMHHIHGSPLTVPLPQSRHLDAHMPGGFRWNSGGPGTSG